MKPLTDDTELQRCLDGMLDADGRQRLEDALRGDPGLRKRLLMLAGFEAELPAATREVTAQKAEPARVALRRVALAAGAPALRRPGRTAWIPWLALAACLAVAAGIAWVQLRAQRRAPPAVARAAQPPAPAAPARSVAAPLPPQEPVEGRLAEIEGDVWLVRRGVAEPRRVSAPGADVHAGESIAVGTNGFARFVCADGSRFNVHRRTLVTPGRDGGGLQMKLEAGALDADISKQPTGQVAAVRTSLLTVRVVGTQFRTVVDSRSAWVGVRTGSVEVTRVADGRRLVLRAGNYSAVAPNWPYMVGTASVCPMWKGVCRAAAGDEYP